VATTAPSTVGMWNSSPGAFASCSSVMGPSVAPKSTVRSVIWRMPPPLPIDWKLKRRVGSTFAYSSNHFE